MIIENVKNIIFDLDGTLWNSSVTCARAWNNVLKRENEGYKPISTEQILKVMGLKHDELAALLLPDFDKGKQNEIMEKCYEEEIVQIKKEGASLYREDLEDILKDLSSKYPLFIVSNCQKGYVEAFLEYYDLAKYFIDHECSGNTNLPKNKNIEMIIKRNNLNNAIYIGDTKGDKEAAELAGVPFVLANYGFGEVKSAAYSINCITDIFELLGDMDMHKQEANMRVC